MDSYACMGLTLMWTRTRGAEWILSCQFGITGTPISVWVRFGMRMLVHILKQLPDSYVRLPTAEKVQEYKDAITSKYSLLQDCYCVADGLKIYLQQAGEFMVQNKFYNGWKCDHYVNNVFAFAPDGTIIAAVVNAPGCMHDSQIADFGYLYDKLQIIWEQSRGRCVMDSAFCKSRFEYIVKSSQELPLNASIREHQINTQATSVRQSAEWGMRAFQGSFPRIKDRMIYEERGERKLILKFVVLLYNYRARKVGLNQILNTYMPELSKDYLYRENIT